MSPRTPEKPALANGRFADAISPDVTVKLVADPIVAPVEFKNEMLPVQDAAVPLDDADATLTTLMRAVSVLPRPAGGRVIVRVPVVDVCAKTDNMEPATMEVKMNFRINILRLSRGLSMTAVHAKAANRNQVIGASQYQTRAYIAPLPGWLLS